MTVIDTRKEQLTVWLSRELTTPKSMMAASSDASFRRYFRCDIDGRSVVVMDAPPPQEDCRPFVDITKRLAAAGCVVPEILAEDCEQGFLALSDLGNNTFLECMNKDNSEVLYKAAITSLVCMQKNTDTSDLPAYDRALLQREVDLFPEWYLKAHRKIDYQGEIKTTFEALTEKLISDVLQHEKTFVHRDYMPRNLMADDVLNGAEQAGIIDFQDAVIGPISYDIACLYKDAFISWPEEVVIDGQKNYWQQALQAGLPVPGDFTIFQQQIDYMAVQRHLKVIGIFARICHRDGKPKYLEDVPRFFHYLSTAAKRYKNTLPELQQLLTLLEEGATE